MILGDFEINEKDIEEYFKPYEEYQYKIVDKLENKEVNYNKLMDKIFDKENIYDYRASFLVKDIYNVTESEAEDIAINMDVIWMYINQLKDKLKYDYPLFYEDEGFEYKLFFKVGNKYYVAFLDDYNEYIIKLDEYIKDNKVKVKYYLDVDTKTVNKFLLN